MYCFESAVEYNTFFNGTLELAGIDYTGAFTDPRDIARLRALAPSTQETYEALARKCLDGPSGKYLKYVGTAATARDIVSMADAIDGEGAPVNYIGTSYGTYLGARLVNSECLAQTGECR